MRVALLVLAVSLLPASAHAQWFLDDMEEHALGQLEGQGGWMDFFGGFEPYSMVVDSQALRGDRSVEVNLGANTTHPFDDFTSGRWTVSMQTLVPQGMQGKSWFTLMNKYDLSTGFEWGLQLGFNGTTDLVECDCGTDGFQTLPLVYGEWRELRVDLDLDGDLCTIYYDGVQLGSYIWSQGVFGIEAFQSLQIEALVLFPDFWPDPGATEIYYDDFGIVAYTSDPGTPLCFGDGSGARCPCANESASGAGEGCRNSTGAGASLAMSGSASVAADDLIAMGAGLVPGQPALLFAGENALDGGAGTSFGDGLRCTGQNAVRLSVQQPDAAGGASFGPGLGASGSWKAGDTRYFQLWYRDPNGGPCASGFNLSHSYRVPFAP